MGDFTETSVFEMLRAKYRDPEWGIVRHVRNSTGFGRGKVRTADALAMSLWPSNGLHLHGFEIKVSRSDWQKEMQDLTKAAAFEKHCHYWWIVAPAKMVKLEELPATWGLQEPTASGNLRVKKPATFTSAEPMDANLMAALFRAIARQAAENDVILEAENRGYQRAWQKAEETRKTIQNAELAGLRKENTRLQETISLIRKEFQCSHLHHFDIQRLAEVYRLGKAYEDFFDAEQRIDLLVSKLAAAKEVVAASRKESTP